MKPKYVKAIYDNHGTKDETFDRYTIVFHTKNNHYLLYDCLSLSHNPASPQGFSQFDSCAIGDHLGKQIKWSDLPFEIRGHIAYRMVAVQS